MLFLFFSFFITLVYGFLHLSFLFHVRLSVCVCLCVEIELSYVHTFNIVVIGLEQAARRSTCIQKCDLHSNICMHNIFIYFILSTLHGLFRS